MGPSYLVLSSLAGESYRDTLSELFRGSGAVREVAEEELPRESAVVEGSEVGNRSRVGGVLCARVSEEIGRGRRRRTLVTKRTERSVPDR